MGLFSLSQALGFAGKILDNRVSTEPAIEFSTDKPPCPQGLAGDLPRCAPEEEGIPSSHITQFLRALSEDKTLNMHSVTILRHGRVLCEVAFGAQRLDVWKYTFSACKSVVSLAIGLLIDDGLLDPSDRVVEIFPKEAGAIGKIKLKDLTVEDLLTMRSSVFFTELDSISEPSWLKGFFNAPLRGEMGKTFYYNSLNTYLLSAIIKKKTERPLSDFLQDRLFAPLGIKGDAWHWESCPLGTEKGGWGLYMRQEDLAKLALLVMQNGRWNGAQIVSESYLAEATSKKVAVQTAGTRFDYGYHIWVGKQNDTFLFNGLFGQNVLGFRHNGIVIACNAGNGELFQQSNFFAYAERFFDRNFDDCLPQKKKEFGALKDFCTSLSAYKPERKKLCLTKKEPSPLDTVVGRRFVYREGFEKSVGFLPLFLQAIHNVYTKGFVSIAFSSCEDGSVLMHYEERNRTITVPVGLRSPAVSTVQFGETAYTVAASARMVRDEDGHDILVIRIDFLEFPSSRVIKLDFLNEDTVLLRNEETPGESVSRDLIRIISEQVQDISVLSTVMDRIGSDYFEFKAERAFAPRLILQPTNE